MTNKSQAILKIYVDSLVNFNWNSFFFVYNNLSLNSKI